MKKLLFSTAILVWMASPSSAFELSCNAAVQNWANGSKTTCPFNSGGSAVVHSRIERMHRCDYGDYDDDDNDDDDDKRT